jgi:diguanylate cyclase (GGDEF)-like protein
MRKELWDVAFHDLRTHLQVVLLNARQLAVDDRPADGAATVRRARRVERRAHLLARVLERLDDLVRFGTDLPDQRPAPLDLGLTVESCGRALDGEAGRRGIRLAMVPPADDGTVTVLADPARVQELLFGLMHHALDSAGPGSTITGSVEAQGGEALFTVRYTAASGDRRSRDHPLIPGGWLPRCLEELGAQVWTELEGRTPVALRAVLPGVTVLRRSEQPAEPGLDATPAPAAPRPAVEPAPTVLVIEDDRDSADVIAELLSPDYAVEIEGTGLGGLARAQLGPPPALIVLDLALPGMDGIAILRRLKADPNTRPIPVLIASGGCRDVELRIKLLGLGAADLLSKPFHAVELRARIRRVFADMQEQMLLRAQAQSDELTGLPNLRCFRARLTEELARTRRYATPLCLVLVDLDHLKAINDGHGHEEGSRALGHVAGTLRRAARETDTVARIGGDEFAVLLPHTDLESAVKFCDRVRSWLRSAEGPGAARPVTVSIGLAVHRGRSDPVGEALFRRADAALYQAKRDGRDTARVASNRRITRSCPVVPLLGFSSPF